MLHRKIYQICSEGREVWIFLRDQQRWIERAQIIDIEGDLVRFRNETDEEDELLEDGDGASGNASDNINNNQEPYHLMNDMELNKYIADQKERERVAYKKDISGGKEFLSFKE